jgi:hypothetical protein
MSGAVCHLRCTSGTACWSVSLAVRVIITIILASCLVLLGWILLSDDPPPDVSVLIAPSERPFSDSPLAEYQRDLAASKVSESQSFGEVGWQLMQAIPDTESVERLTWELESAIDAFWTLEATSPASWKWDSTPTEPIGWWINEGFSTNGLWTFPVRLVLLEARVKRDASSFWSDWARVQRVLWEMVRAEPGLWEFNDLANQSFEALRAMREWIDAHPPSAEDLGLIQNTLEATLPESRCLARVLRLAYFEVGDRLTRDQIFLRHSGENPLLTAWSLKPNRTLGDLRMDFELAVLALDESWEAIAEVADDLNDGTSPGMSLPNRAGWRGNARGERMRASVLHQTMILVPVMLDQLHEHRLAIVQVAIRRFEVEAGRLPTSLDELVPHYLESIPVNPKTGRLSRWDAARRRLHDSPAESLRSSTDSKSSRFTLADYWWKSE